MYYHMTSTLTVHICVYIVCTYLYLLIISTNFCTVKQDGKSEKAVDKALELIGEWKVAFGQQAGYKAVYDTFSELQREGFHIPEGEIASAAFIKKPPEWVQGERCFMCRTEFNRFKGAFRVCAVYHTQHY